MFIIVQAVKVDNPKVNAAYFEFEVDDASAEAVAASVGGVIDDGYEWTVTTSETSRLADPLAGLGDGEPEPLPEPTSSPKPQESDI